MKSIIVNVGKRTYVARRQVGSDNRYRAVAEILTGGDLDEALRAATAEHADRPTPIMASGARPVRTRDTGCLSEAEVAAVAALTATEIVEQEVAAVAALTATEIVEQEVAR